jgi:hypothetical protein
METRHRGGLAQWRRRLGTSALALLTALGVASCGAKRELDAGQNMTMTPSITYLHLLRHTPFFTALSTAQLQWVIDHSREWAADKGAVVAKCDSTSVSDMDYWILLDGGWQLQHDGRTFASGHADPGKWFSAAESNGTQCSLIATEHSYVMRIGRPEMQAMLDEGFAFRTHLDSGEQYYRSIFSGRAAVAASPSRGD